MFLALHDATWNLGNQNCLPMQDVIVWRCPKNRPGVDTKMLKPRGISNSCSACLQCTQRIGEASSTKHFDVGPQVS